MIKKCKTCEVEKALLDFPKKLDCIDGHAGSCRSCKHEKDKKRLYDVKISEKIKPLNSLKVCCTCKVEKGLANFSKKSNQKDGFMKRCKQCVAEHYQKTKYNSRITQKNYYEINKESINTYKNKWTKEKRKKDINFKISTNLTALLRSSLSRNNINKSKKTLKTLDCSWEHFKNHLESQFTYWMTWENYGNVCGTELEYNCSWDLDHIIPISYAKTEEEIYMLNHWSNFQPLCSKVNRDIKKANVYPCSNLELKITFNKK